MHYGLRILRYLVNKIRIIIKRSPKISIYSVLPQGVDFIKDIRTFLPACRFDVVFDVGANIGQSARKYLSRFPNSYIYCFEPVSDTFRRLKDNLKSTKRVEFYQLALGSSNGKGEIVIHTDSSINFIVGQSKEPLLNDNMKTESVDIATLDEFCKSNRIDRINFLKIDTEGGDLEVLKGASNMLIEQKIDLVQVEAGMNPGNTRHVPFDDLKDYLELHGYFIFRIYEQMHEWPTNEPHLRRVDPIFVSQRIIDMNRKSD